MHERESCGQSRRCSLGCLLTQHLLAGAARNLLLRRGFPDCGHSSGQILLNPNRPFSAAVIDYRGAGFPNIAPAQKNNMETFRTCRAGFVAAYWFFLKPIIQAACPSLDQAGGAKEGAARAKEIGSGIPFIESESHCSIGFCDSVDSNSVGSTAQILCATFGFVP